MIKEKITALVKQDNKTNKKKIENLVFALLVLIITLISINIIFNKEDKTTPKIDKKIKEVIETKEKERDLEKELKGMLEKMNGIEEAQVLITYSETEKFVPVYNENSSQSTTSEKDTEGGERKIESIDISKEAVSDANQNPITEKMIYPKAEGAIILIKGRIDISTKEDIIHAISAITGLATHKIQILEIK